ncbi:MAG: ABC transporter ATP-binding protein [Nitrososphaerota archaeon]|nr:energy-coupling factor ABC transporter ATP-binding protein [Candidatus Geocrenenecus dongiae]
MKLIDVEDLWFKYAGSDQWVLRNICLEVEEGEFVLIAGKSGCGKSTLLKCFNGLIPHFYEGEFKGKVEVCGLDTREYPPYILSQYAGMVFQNPDNQLFALSVEADIAFALENIALPREEIRERVDWAIKVLGIEDLRERSPVELSSGQKQKVAIASILAMKPKVMLLDEPTSSLDPVSAKQLVELIAELNRRHGLTIVITEHRIDMLLPYISRIVVIEDGEIALDGDPRQVLEKYDLRVHGVAIPKLVRVSNTLRKIIKNPLPTPLSVDEFVNILRSLKG